MLHVCIVSHFPGLWWRYVVSYIKHTFFLLVLQCTWFGICFTKYLLKLLLTGWSSYIVIREQTSLPLFRRCWHQGIRGTLHMVSERRSKHSGLSGVKNDCAYFVFVNWWSSWLEITGINGITLIYNTKYRKVQQIPVIMY